MFDPKLLTSFTAVARTRHFGKAAESIHATQPGVSQHVAKLEEQLGFRLLERTKRSVSLTPAGELFYERSKQLLSMLQRMEDEARQIASGGLGELRVGISSWVIHTEIPNRISRFRIANPNIAMQFKVQGGDILKRMMDEGDIDLMISPLPIAGEDYESFHLNAQEMGVAMPSRHALGERRSVTLQDLRNEDFIVVPREYDPESHDRLLSRMHELGVSLRISAYETPSLNAIARVAVGEGVALVPMGYRTAKQDSVQVVRLKDPALGIANIYVTVRRRNREELTQRLLDALNKKTGD